MLARMDALPTLSAGGLELVPLRSEHLPEVLRVLTDPTVARWWGVYDEARVRDEYGEDAEGTAFLIQVDGHPAGIIQFGEELDPDYRHASIDIAISTAWQGRGLGPRAIRLLAGYLFEARGHHRLTIDPAAANRNAIRAYESVGFKPVGVMRQYERGPDGTWHDGLLMDLLAGELT
jgi:aminoglycoside 6'-N-acetyltransferase